MAITPADATAVVRTLWRRVLDHDVGGLAALLAYRFALAMLWVLIFSAALSGFAAEAFGGANPTQALKDLLISRFPPDAEPVLDEQIDQLIGAHSVTLLLSGLFGSLWTGTFGFTAVMNSLNRVHGIPETRPYLARVALALGLTLSVGALLLAVFVLLLVRQIAGDDIAREIGLSGAPLRIADALAVVLAIMVLIGATAVVYRVTPNTNSDLRWVSAGALLFVAAWLIASFLFGIYLSNFEAYANAYGAIGALLVLFSWFFITSFTLLLGAEVNALLGARRPDGSARTE